jgi:sugar (glycoside-pentoside-hexuronide) transporter
MRVVYAYVTLSLMMIAYSAVNIPYSALLGVLTPNSEDRTSACSYRFVLAFIPIFIIAYCTIPIATHFGGSPNSPKGWQMAMIVFSTIAVIAYFVTFLMTRERVQPARAEAGSLRNDLRDLFGNRPWVVLSVVGVAALAYGNVRNTVIVYYFQYVVPNGDHYFSSIVATGALAFIIGVILTSPLSRRFGKRNFYMWSMSIAALLTIGYYWVPPANIPLVWGGHLLISLFTAPTAPLVWAMYADTADYSEWKNGRRATGLVFSAASFAQKFGWAIGGGGAGWLLAYFGYVPNVAQSAHTVNGIMLMVTIIPSVAAVIAIAGLWFYGIDEKMMKQISADLASRHNEAERVAKRTAAAVESAAPSSPAESVGNPAAAVASAAAGSAGRSRQVASGPRVLPGGYAAGVGRGTASNPVSSPLSAQQRATLAGEFASVLADGVHGFCFSPYVEGQAPGCQVTEAQIRARLEIIRPYTRWVRTFSCTDGHEHSARIAHELGMKTLVGAWLGADRDANERELAGLIGVARAGHADLVAVGNEVLLREELAENELIDYLERARKALPGVQVGYVDAYYLFELHPRVTDACDVVMTNCYPFWEGCPREQASDYMQSMYRRTCAAARGKRVVISETGWPDTGTPFHGAVPSCEDAMRYFIDANRWAAQDNVELFYFAAFDEAWKIGAEGDVGSCWGLWDKHGNPKYADLPPPGGQC